MCSVQSIVDSRSVRHIAQGVLAHILGRLPCPKIPKTPRKIGNSMLAQCQYRMKIRRAENYCRIFSCATKICKNLHQLANCITIRTHHNGRIVAESSTALQHQSRLAPQATTRCETVGEKLRFGRTTSRGIAPYQNGLAQSTR